MNGANQRSALAALDQARPAITRLDLSRDADDNAADLLESWGAVETALRARPIDTAADFVHMGDENDLRRNEAVFLAPLR